MPHTAQSIDLDDPAALKRLGADLYSRPARLFASACSYMGMLAALLILSACGGGGFTLEKAELDRSIVTGSVTSTPSAGDTDMASDQATIRNAVSSVDLDELGGKPLPWANSDTGSRGAITGMAQSGGKGRFCRTFDVSRERFDSVAMFKGTACMIEAGDWRLESFAAL